MTSHEDISHERLISKIKVLNEVAWEGRIDNIVVQEWLGQFGGDSQIDADREKLEMLYLLSNFIFFGAHEIRELVKSLYRDLFKYRIVENIRKQNSNTTDRLLIEKEYQDELKSTLFLPVGNPSESSCHLLYFFRQENQLGKEQFSYVHEVFASGDFSSVRNPRIQRYVFLDDLCGSGQQGNDYCRDFVTPLKKALPNAEVAYYVLFAAKSGLKKLRGLNLFDHVDCAVELDETFKAFSDCSRFFPNSVRNVDKSVSKKVAEHYGRLLQPSDPLGYREGELMLGFNHNVPDNTLPIFWYDEKHGPPWYAVFPRYPKNYGWGQE